MSEVKTVHIDERIPARIVRSGDGESAPLCNVTVRRTMNVLVHPVPPLEMENRSGRFHRGGKVFVDWPPDAAGWEAVVPGDRLEVEGKSFTIKAVSSCPVCYGEIYVDEP
jgi:hypothetical protein